MLVDLSPGCEKGINAHDFFGRYHNGGGISQTLWRGGLVSNEEGLW